MKLTRLFGSSSMYIPTRLASSTLISLVIGLSILGCGSSNNGPPLDVGGTWTGTYLQSYKASGGSTSTTSVDFTLVVTQTGDKLDYSGTINGGLSDGVTWVCQNGMISGKTITLPSCTVKTPNDTCTATVTNRKDVIDDKVTPWTMSPRYSYTWSGTCLAEGYTVTVPASGETATLSKQ